MHQGTSDALFKGRGLVQAGLLPSITLTAPSPEAIICDAVKQTNQPKKSKRNLQGKLCMQTQGKPQQLNVEN